MFVLAQQAGMPWWVWLAIIGGAMTVLGGRNKCNGGACRPMVFLPIVAVVILIVMVLLPMIAYQRSSNETHVAVVRQENAKLHELEAALQEVSDRIDPQQRTVQIEREPSWPEQPATAPRAPEVGEVAEIVEVPQAAPLPGPEAESPVTYNYDQPIYAVPAWFQVDNVFLIADTYPSLTAAARGLAAQVPDLAPQILADGEILKTVTVRTQNLELAGPFIDTLTDRLDDISTRIVRSDIYEFKHNEGNILAQLMPTAGHQLTLVLVGTAGDRTRSAISVNKPWVDHFDEWTAHNAGSWFVAHSPEAANSSIEATHGARGYAAAAITQLLSEQLAASVGQVDTGTLNGLVAEVISRGQPVKDAFVQQFSRPNYDVWRSLLLIDLSDESIRSIPQAYLKVTSHERASVAWRVGSGVALLVVIVGLYGLLNSVTKGYYVGTLRLTGLVLIIAVVTALVLVLS